MAEPAVPQPQDRDLVSIAEARALARRARQAANALGELSQAQIDAIVTAVAETATANAEVLARLAVDETGFGVYEDKIQKNLFASQKVYSFIKPMKTVGVIARHEDRRVVEIAEPFGVVAAIVPSTNPTSTTIYKVLIALKARCSLVISPHPSAVQCITRTAELLADAARRAGAPDGSVNWMTTVSLEGTQELMRQREVAVILATGGMGLVRAAYSAGKPAYGVGPGNAPAYVERTADVRKAVRDIITGKTFDNGLLCSSENSVVVDAPIAEQVKREFQAQGAHFLSKADTDKVTKVLVTPQRLPNPALVGKSATIIAAACGVSVPDTTRVLIAELDGVGRDYPLSIEKLCPVLSFYVVSDWREGCERCKQILRYGGMGHTMGIHSQNEQVILEFGLKKPAFRIAVNTPTTFGSTGISSGLDPAMTLGCGGFGGNITSDNITPRHLLNVKRLAYETTSVPNRFERASGRTALPSAPKPASANVGISAEVLTQRIDQFLGARGIKPATAPSSPASGASEPSRQSSAAQSSDKPLDFVCEEDVRLALRDGRTLLVSERAIVTPSARDLAERTQTIRIAALRS
ncbi:MAG: aldehyde dehydrogenase family protein [Vicinamibacterales bacterium]